MELDWRLSDTKTTQEVVDHDQRQGDFVLQKDKIVSTMNLVETKVDTLAETSVKKASTSSVR